MKIKELALGVDIGGTNVAIGLCDSAGNIHFETNLSTRNIETPEGVVDLISNYIAELNINKHLIGIGVGAPNGNYLTGCIDFAPNLPWKGKIELAKLFENKFKKRTFLTNDANAAALGEMIFGQARNYKDFVVITLGTGLGSGIVINGELIYGADALAGEYGHIRVKHNGRLCGCGRKGCLETYVSSTGVVRSINEMVSEHRESSHLIGLDNPSAKDVFEASQNGDKFALHIIDYTAQILGSALADFACFSNPEAYILFGGIAQSGQDFADKVKQYMEENILNIYSNRIDVKSSALHDKNAAILGAASLVWSHLK